MLRFLGLVAFSILFLSSCKKNSAPPSELVVYAYDSFLAKGGLGEAIFPVFEKRCRCEIRALSFGDGAGLIQQLNNEIRAGGTPAQIVIGLDQTMWNEAQQWVEGWGGSAPKGYERLVPDVARAVKAHGGFLPFDYGAQSLMINLKKDPGHQALKPIPLSALLSPSWKKNLLLLDPRSSSPGLDFLLYTAAVLKEGVWDFWKAAKDQWKLLAPGWDLAYGLFTEGQAVATWSYVSSEAYHLENEGTQTSFRALLFEEGQPLQIETAVSIRGEFRRKTDFNLESARWGQEFLAYLLSTEVQSLVPLKNWMHPVLQGVSLPESYRKLPVVKRWVPLIEDRAEIRRIREKWESIVR